jgi:hypothetical protein
MCGDDARFENTCLLQEDPKEGEVVLLVLWLNIEISMPVTAVGFPLALSVSSRKQREIFYMKLMDNQH